MLSEAEITEIRGYAVDAGVAAPGEPVTIEALGGGISNDVYALSAGGREYVLKRALAKLRVAADWRSDITRIHREAACQRWLCGVLRAGEVPAVVWEDTERHVYLMERAPREALNWKDELLAGRVPARAAERAADLLGRVHAAGAGDAALRAAWSDKTVFDQLRLDPYLRTIAARHTDLAAPIIAEIDRLGSAVITLVHGDFSPKNLLLMPDGCILLDHEVAHYGDPRFDLGFLFTHLVLKALHVTAAAEPLWAQIPTAWAAYRSAWPGVGEAAWLPTLGCILLARVDGKSPAGYLTEAEEERVRRLARPLIRGEVATLGAVLELARGV